MSKTKRYLMDNFDFNSNTREWEPKVEEYREPEPTFNEASGQWDLVQRCWKCDEVITDWGLAVEDDNGEVKCGDCHQNLVDQTHDAMKEMFGNPIEQLSNLTIK